VQLIKFDVKKNEKHKGTPKNVQNQLVQITKIPQNMHSPSYWLAYFTSKIVFSYWTSIKNHQDEPLRLFEQT